MTSIFPAEKKENYRRRRLLKVVMVNWQLVTYVIIFIYLFFFFCTSAVLANESFEREVTPGPKQLKFDRIIISVVDYSHFVLTASVYFVAE